MNHEHYRTEHLTIIPDFHGEPQTLRNFLEKSELVYTRFYNPEDPNGFHNKFLLSGITNKVKGQAHNLIANSIINTFLELKVALLQAYGDKRDYLTLEIELARYRQNNTETPTQFHDRITEILTLQTAYINNYIGHPDAKPLIKHCNNFALRILLAGLKEPLGSLLRTKSPENLNDALGILTNEFQFFNINSFTSQQKPFKNQFPPNHFQNQIALPNSRPIFQPRIQPPNVRPNYHSGFRYNPSYRPQYNQQQPQQPQNNSFIQRINSNAQRYNSPSTVFRGTPMSIGSTRNVSRPPASPSRQYNRQNNRHCDPINELNNTTTDEPIVEQPDEEHTDQNNQNYLQNPDQQYFLEESPEYEEFT